MTRVEFLRRSAEFEIWCLDSGILIVCFTFYRSPQEQLREYSAHRSRVKYGKHQDWRAKDYAIFDDLNGDLVVNKNEIRWGKDPRYEIMGREWERRGGVWGGRWKGLNDIYHFEG